jgi:hypothetical protein
VRTPIVWSLIGLCFSLGVAAVAWRRRRAAAGFYDGAVYAMTPRTHAGYAIASLAFALFFAGTAALRAETAGVLGLMLFAVIAAFYGTSFLRGAADADE